MRKKVIKCMFALILGMIIMQVARESKASVNCRMQTVVAGDMQSAALTKNGDLFTFGNNFYGALGDGTTNNHWDLQKALIEDVKSVIVGDVMYALKNDGTIWTWGGQKDISDLSKGMYTIPRRYGTCSAVKFLNEYGALDTNGNVIDIENGKILYEGVKNAHSICGEYLLTTDGRMYRFGEGYSKPIANYMSDVVDAAYGNGVYLV